MTAFSKLLSCLALSILLSACVQDAPATKTGSSDGGEQPPANDIVPRVTLTAQPTTVDFGSTTDLTWTSTNSEQCEAGGAWSGVKGLEGAAQSAVLSSTTTFTLTCTGRGGTATQSVTVTVQSAPAPTLTLSANPTSVAYNGSTTLTWFSANAAVCNATGAWTGSKATSGSEVRVSLTASGTYLLTCTGAGGGATQSTTVTVTSGTAGTISGYVDSSLINRNGVNKVYLYAGTVMPDDYDGDSGDPIASATVAQDENACSFGYSFANVAPGNYTIAFTNQAANDVLLQSDALSFIGSANITLGSNALAKNFSAAHVLTVGSGKSYATPSAAYVVAQDGDVIEIDAGVYLDDIVVWRQSNITLRGVGGRAHMKSTKLIPYSGTDTANGMGIWVVRGSNTTVENVELSGASVPDQNGAGIRADGL